MLKRFWLLMDGIRKPWPVKLVRRWVIDGTWGSKRIGRLMRMHGLGIKACQRLVHTTDGDHDTPIFLNLYCDVIPSRPNLVSVADFTYICIGTWFCYLADTSLALVALRSAVRS